MKTTKLLYPEWQGYGEDKRFYDGAYTVHEAFSGGTPFFEVEVPADENLIVEGGILGRSATVRSATIALDHLAQVQPDRIFMIGGTCGSEIAPVSYLNQHYQGDFKGALIPAAGGLALDHLVPVLTDLNSHYSVVGLSVVEFASNNSVMATKILALLEKSGITWASA